MEQPKFQRKLTAILSADAVGFSRLMGDDEEETVRQILACKAVMQTIIEKHGGRVVDSPGDNVLAEFSSVLHAVRSAVEVQEEFRVRNKEIPEERRMLFRIGINLGDVVQEGDHIYGDGVNIAARIEGLADPGGICISGTVYEHIRHKLTILNEYLGEHRVKNIREPVSVYRVELSGPGQDQPLRFKRKGHGRRALWLGLAGVILAALAGGAAFIWGPDIAAWLGQARQAAPASPSSVPAQASLPAPPPAASPAPAPAPAPSPEAAAPEAAGAPEAAAPAEETPPPAPATPPAPARPSLLVRPFASSNPDPAQGRLAQGLGEQLQAGLATLGNLDLLKPSPGRPGGGQAAAGQEQAPEPVARYVLEGQVERAGSRLRVFANLTDTASGRQVWAQRYDRELSDIFALQEEIIGHVLGALFLDFREEDQRRLKSLARSPLSLEVYEEAFRRAAQEEPQDPKAWNNLGLILRLRDKTEEAIAAYRRAVGLDSFYALAYKNLGVALEKISDRAGAAEAYYAYARLAPEAPDAGTVKARADWLGQQGTQTGAGR